MQEVTQTLHLFMELVEMLKNKLLPTILVLLLQYPILLYQRVFPLIFTKNQDPRRYSSCQGTFQRLILILAEILYPKS